MEDPGEKIKEEVENETELEVEIEKMRNLLQSDGCCMDPAFLAAVCCDRSRSNKAAVCNPPQ